MRLRGVAPSFMVPALVTFLLAAGLLLVRPSTYADQQVALFGSERLGGELQLDLGRGFFTHETIGAAAPAAPVHLASGACPPQGPLEAAAPSGEPLGLWRSGAQGGSSLVHVPAAIAEVSIALGGETARLRRPAAVTGATALLIRDEGTRCIAEWARAHVTLPTREIFLSALRGIRFPVPEGAAGERYGSRLALYVGPDPSSLIVAEPAPTRRSLAFAVEALPGPDSLFTRTVKLFTAGIAGFGAGLLGLWLNARRSAPADRPSRPAMPAVVAGVAATAYLAFWLAASWPGRVSWDVSAAIISHLQADHHGWYAWFYPLLVSGALELGSIAWLTLLNWLAHLLVIWLVVLSFGARRGGYPAAIAIAVSLLLTCIGPASAYHLRDVFNGVVLALLALVAFRACDRERRADRSSDALYLAALTLLVATALLLRIDNAAVVLPIAAVFLWRGAATATARVAALACALAITVAVPQIAKRTTTSRSAEELILVGRTYGTSAFISGAGAVISSPGFDYGRYADAVAAVHRVVDYGTVVRHFRVDDSDYWNKFGRFPLDPGDDRRMRDAFVTLALAYPFDFLKRRFITFIGTMNGFPGLQLRITRMDDQIHLRNLPLRSYRLGYVGPKHPPLRRAGDRLANRIMERASSWPGLAVTLVVAVLALVHGATATLAVASGALARAAAFFVFQPHDVFFYLYELQFLLFLLPLMYWTERQGAVLPLRTALRRFLDAAGGWMQARAPRRLAATSIAAAAVLAFTGLGAWALLAGAREGPSGRDEDGRKLVAFLDALEGRVHDLARSGCGVGELSFRNDAYRDRAGQPLHGPDRFPAGSEACRVFGADALEPLVAPGPLHQPSDTAGLSTGMLEFALRAVPGVGGDAPELVAVVTHVDPLLCAYADRHATAAGATGRIFYLPWAFRPLDASAEATPEPFPAQVHGRSQFCIRDDGFPELEAQKHTHLVRVLAPR